jgi:mRNA interferase MazF
MEISRGDLVTVAVAGDYGKPRPALVVHADAFRGLDSCTVLRLTSDLHLSPLVRIAVDPMPENGLRRRPQIMIDKATSVPRSKIGRRIGRVEPHIMQATNAALARFFVLELVNE